MDEKNPLENLVRNITPDTSNKLKSLVLPPMEGIMFAIGPLVYRVGQINAGQLRFSAEFYGLRVENGILRPGGTIETRDQHHNQNVTLDVHSASLDGAAIFGKRGENNQTKVD
jgi:hypothetical protein